MHPKRKRKLITIIFLMIGLSIGIGLILYALRQNVDLYYTPAQIRGGHIPVNKTIRLGGIVQKATLTRDKDSLTVHFIVTDFHKTIAVQYTGVLPALFREGQGIVADGHINAQGVYIATQVLAKHDEKYRPPGIVENKKAAL